MTFILKHPKIKDKTTPKESLIMCDYHFEGKRMRFSTGEKISPAHWNPKTARPRASAPSAATMTKFLDRLENRVKEVHLDMKSQFLQITPESLKQAIIRDIRFDGKRETLLQFFARLIEEKRPNTKPGTLEVYNSAIKLLQSYPYAKDFGDISPSWFEKYQTWLENYRSKKIKEGYSANYISKNVAIIREVMTIARKQGLHRNDVYKNDDYKKPHENVDTIYLTVDELMSMYKADLSEAMGRVRDRFLIGAFTGLRFSDSAKITHDSIRDGLIVDRNIKTRAQVAIPIHWIVQEILDRYPDGLPPSISNQKTNEFLKQIGEDAGITSPVTITKTKGGKLHSVVLPKCKLITTHTARRSAATNMFLNGIPPLSIAKITGHKTESSLMKYIRMSSEENARLLASHPFFNKPSEENGV